MLTQRFCVSNVRTFLRIAKYSTHNEWFYSSRFKKQDADKEPLGWGDAKPFKKMPGPMPLPLLGNMWKFLPGGEFHNLQIDEILKVLVKKYGTIVRFQGLIGRNDMVYVFDPHDIEHVLRSAPPHPKKDNLESVTYYRSVMRKHLFNGLYGLVVSNGELWYMIRSLVNPILMQHSIHMKYTTKMDDIAKDLIKYIKHQMTGNERKLISENFVDELHKWAMESVGVVALNRRLGALDVDNDENSEVHTFIKAVLRTFEHLYKLDILPAYWKYLPSKTFRGFVKNMDFVVSTTKIYVDDALKYTGTIIPDDELGVLQRIGKTDKKIAFTTTLDMLQAGVNTTGKTMGSALYFLAKNPDKQKILRDEIIKLLPDKDSVVTEDMLPQMKYLNAVIRETTRMSPIAIATLRTTTNKIVLRGYQIPKDVNLLCTHIYYSALSNDYIVDADKFVPERMLRSNVDENSFRKLPKFLSMPFGFGARSCVGKRLANLEMSVALANLIRNFEFSWDQPDLKFGARLLYGFLGPLKLTIKELEQ